jgi:DNA replication protein
VLFARLIKEKPSGWSLAEITELMTIDAHACSQVFMELIHDGFLLVESKEDEQGLRSENYSLAPLLLRVETILKKDANVRRQHELEDLYVKLEHLFGVLSPRDVELIQMWISDDGFDANLIELALAEMQMHDIRSLKYVDKILLDWKRKNIYTVDEAKRSLIDFRSRRVVATGVSNGESTGNPKDYYDWIGKIKQGLE